MGFLDKLKLKAATKGSNNLAFKAKTVTTVRADGIHMHYTKKEACFYKDPATGKLKIKLGLGWKEAYPSNTTPADIDYLPFYRNKKLPCEGIRKFGNAETGHPVMNY